MIAEKNTTLLSHYKELEQEQENKLWEIIHRDYWPRAEEDFRYKELKQASCTIFLKDHFKKYYDPKRKSFEQDDPEYDNFIYQIDEYFFGLFKQITDQPIYAMNWNHSCYEIDVQKLDLQLYKKILIEENSFLYEKGANYYLLSIVPDGDYHMFFTKDMKQGVLGHPWEQTLCLFGEDLIKTFKNSYPSNLSQVIFKP